MRALRSVPPLLALLAGFVTGVTPASATTPPLSTAHPYSDPIWMPIHAPFEVGCIGSSTSNNSPAHCSGDHVGFYGSNFGIPWKVPPGVVNPVPHPYVYPAGAGVVRSTSTGAPPCASTSTGLNDGNSVVVDHGGGVVSVYLHLQQVLVHPGQLVAPRIPLGTAGATGSVCINGKPGSSYLDFRVEHNGGTYPRETAVAVPVLLGCVGTTTTVERLPGASTTWIKVPWDTVYYRPSSDWNCVPSGIPTSPPREYAPAVPSHTGTSLTMRWHRLAAVNRYAVQLQVYKGGKWQAPCPPWQLTGCNSGYWYVPGWYSGLTLRNLLSGTMYRIRVSGHSVGGYGLWSGWSVAVRL